MLANNYSVTKLAHHPAVLENLRDAVDQAPVLVQIFPTNLCQQSCSFCSFGSGPEVTRAKVLNPPKSAWKNQQLFEPRASISWNKLRETIDCLAAIGTKAVEVTGGGEPTTYPYFRELLQLIAFHGLDLALVSNGVLVADRWGDLLRELPWVWARISIDAGTPEEYVATRNVPRSHWDKAWKAVTILAAAKRHPEAAVGVGYVIDRDNWRSVFEGCRLAKEHGADNVRISAAFTPDGMRRFAPEALASVPAQILRARDELEDGSFRIHDLAAERWTNIQIGKQSYRHCAWKDVGCLIGADSNVYACCSLAYHRAGLMGTILDKTFKEMWFGEGAAWRAQHDPRKDCRIHCLYWKRNVEALKLMADPAYAAEVIAQPKPAHSNFL